MEKQAVEALTFSLTTIIISLSFEDFKMQVKYDQIKSKTIESWKVGDIAITMEDDQFEIVDVVNGIVALRELTPQERVKYEFATAIVNLVGDFNYA